MYTTASFAPTLLPSWRAASATVLAEYEAGSAAGLKNRAGKGFVYTILPDADFATANLAGLIRYVLNDALLATGNRPLIEITGTDENMEVASRYSQKGMLASIVNHNDSERDVTLRTDINISECIISNELSTKNQPAVKANKINILVPKNEAVIVACR